ncbi:MAG: 16S rRNA (guanine(966)-N(2))-methyltransferase RsmD [Luteitalea sp.]|nr:16S rRNA (guanine(966)-N(2))-methyltransferase RsmD [Luteitalea sp.]
MRVIAGRFKGRTLAGPKRAGLRPTSDRLRETLFNILAPELPGARLLDGYAGTGAVGIEALSRGAAHVVFVERDRQALALIQQNLGRCGVTERYTIVSRDAREASTDPALQHFDIVFLDPPYDLPDADRALDVASGLVAPGGLLVFEHAARRDVPRAVGRLIRRRQVRAGDSMLTFYKPAEEERQ